MAFARKQTVAPRLLDLNATIEAMLKMLWRLIGENIELVWRPGKDLWPVRMDPAQLDQILANLCVNARETHALLKAGRELNCRNLLILTENMEKTETAKWFGLRGEIRYQPLWQWLMETEHGG